MPKGYNLNLIGQVFGRLTVVSKADTEKQNSRWLCKCECGNTPTVVGSYLTRKIGPTRSCGCLGKEIRLKALRTHGKTGTPEFTAWVNMMDRCYNKNRPGYECYYGGRGIVVDKSWHGSEGVIKFIADMGQRPSKQHSLDRTDVNKGYSPDNCRWATKQEQSKNRRAFKSLNRFSDGEIKGEAIRRGLLAA